MKITVIEPHHETLTSRGHIRTMPIDLELAGRVCYKSEEKITLGSADKFIRAIVRSGHLSVIEHASITVRIVGDRSMSHQLVRHRIAAFSQESQRYCNYLNLGWQVICPPSIGVPAGEYDWSAGDGVWSSPSTAWMNALMHAFTVYSELVESGVKPEDARSVLPNAMKTEVNTTFNLRQWRHVFEERALNKHAQWQIRGIMLGILAEFQTLLPCVFGDLKSEESVEGASPTS